MDGSYSHTFVEARITQYWGSSDSERVYIHSLEYSLRILCDDLKMSTEGNVCTSLNALQHIFDRRVPITAATEWIWFG